MRTWACDIRLMNCTAEEPEPADYITLERDNSKCIKVVPATLPEVKGTRGYSSMLYTGIYS